MRRLRTSGLQFLLALMLSLALWTFVSFTQNPTEDRVVDVPVDVVEPQEGLVVVDGGSGLPLQPRITANVQVAVPRSDVNDVRVENFSATADLSQLDVGDHTVEIAIDPPRGARVRRYTPTTLSVRIVPEASRTLPVAVVTRNRPAFLFEAHDVRAALTEATATGPQQLLERVARIIVPVDLEGRTATFSDNYELQAVDAEGTPIPGVEISPQRARVTIPIRPRVNVQRVSVLPRIVGQPAPGYTNERGNERIDWNPKYVELIAPFEITGTLTTEQIELTGRTESFTETVQLDDIDPSITLLTSNVITVTVPVVPFQTPSLGPVFVPVNVTNLGADLQWSAQPLGLTINARGTAEQFKQLVNNPVQALVDVRGLGPGTYYLAATVQLPGGLQIVGEQPQVTVTLTAIPSTPTPTTETGG